MFIFFLVENQIETHMSMDVTSMQVVKGDLSVHKENCLVETSFQGSEDIEKIYELAQEGGKNYTLAKELEKHYLMDCTINENYEMAKNKSKNEDENNIHNIDMQNVGCQIRDDTVEMNYLTRFVRNLFCFQTILTAMF